MNSRTDQAAELVKLVLENKIDKAESKIAAAPLLLLEPVTINDPAGRTIRCATAYQAALGAELPIMAAMITNYFTDEDLELNEGEAEVERLRQYDQQIPPDYAEATLYDFSGLAQSITASSNEDIEAAAKFENNETPICIALNEFRQKLTPGVHSYGKHFNIELLIQAYATYLQNHAQWNRQKLNLFWCQVIGYVQRLLTAEMATGFELGRQGLQSIKLQSCGTFKFYAHRALNKGIFPLDSDMHNRLGYHWAVSLFFDHGGDTITHEVMGIRLPKIIKLLRAIQSNKKKAIQNLRFKSSYDKKQIELFTQLSDIEDLVSQLTESELYTLKFVTYDRFIRTGLVPDYIDENLKIHQKYLSNPIYAELAMKLKHNAETTNLCGAGFALERLSKRWVQHSRWEKIKKYSLGHYLREIVLNRDFYHTVRITENKIMGEQFHELYLALNCAFVNTLII
ncbi:MAG: hypothetical protein ABSF18_07230, partial [Gammaproteobacteria bacterium]